VVGPLTVAAGEKLCLRKAQVTGTITVEPGGTLAVGASTIDGAITSAGANGFRMCDSATTGSGAITVSGTTGTMRIGDNKQCAGNSVNGAITLDSNARAVKLARNDINGAVTVSNNSAVNGAVPIVSANAITGALSCEANEPAPSERGRANAVEGAQTGQCVFGTDVRAN
jgi:5'-nucleotidase